MPRPRPAALPGGDSAKRAAGAEGSGASPRGTERSQTSPRAPASRRRPPPAAQRPAGPGPLRRSPSLPRRTGTAAPDGTRRWRHYGARRGTSARSGRRRPLAAACCCAPRARLRRPSGGAPVRHRPNLRTRAIAESVTACPAGSAPFTNRSVLSPAGPEWKKRLLSLFLKQRLAKCRHGVARCFSCLCKILPYSGSEQRTVIRWRPLVV